MRESSISAMLGFRYLGEIQVNMARRWLVVQVALEKKIEIKNVCISEAVGTDIQRECEK